MPLIIRQFAVKLFPPRSNQGTMIFPAEQSPSQEFRRRTETAMNPPTNRASPMTVKNWKNDFCRRQIENTKAKIDQASPAALYKTIQLAYKSSTLMSNRSPYYDFYSQCSSAD